jgi:hypothetical protein
VSKPKSGKYFIEKSQELMRPIDRQIMMCDNVEDLMILASNMMITAKNIYIQRIGGLATKEIMQSMVNDIDERILPMGGEIPPLKGL